MSDNQHLDTTLRERGALSRSFERLQKTFEAMTAAALKQVLDEQKAEIERLRAALHEMIEISHRNSEASLMLIAIRKCAEHALERK